MADDVTRETEVAAAPGQVWRSLTDPSLLAEWLAEGAAVEFTPGGDLTMRTLDGEERSGWIEAAEPPRRLAFWWRERDGSEPTRVEFELEETEDGTRVRVTESRPMALLELRAAELTGGTGGFPGEPQMLVRS